MSTADHNHSRAPSTVNKEGNHTKALVGLTTDLEKVLHLELINSNKDESLINGHKNLYDFNPKLLHEMAATEVTQMMDNEKNNIDGNSKKKRREMSEEERLKLRYTSNFE